MDWPIGATVGSAIGARARRHPLLLGLVLGGAALAAAWATTAAGTSLPRRVMEDFASAPPGGLLFSHVLLVAATIVPTAVGIGAAFPLALALAGGAEAPSRRLGAIYAINTLAAVAGSLMTGFVVIPNLGLEQTLHAATWLLVAGAGLALWTAAEASAVRALGAIPAAAAVVVLVTTGSWDRELLASGSYKYAAAVPPGLDVETALKAGTLIYYRDGPTGTVSVKRLTGSLSLAIDGKVDASTAGDMLTQKLLAHLPLLLHDDPHEVCIIGLGSGVTLASALTHPVSAVDVLEISPEVAEASRLFARSSRPPLDDPRTRLIVADGRTHLALSRRAYDVIVSEPSNPWMAGVAALFTREFFEAARARLKAVRHHLPVDQHLRHQHRGSAVRCRDLRLGVSARDHVAHRRRRSAAHRVGGAARAEAGDHIARVGAPRRLGGPRRCGRIAAVWRALDVPRRRRGGRPGSAPARRCRPTIGWRSSSPVRARCARRRVATTSPVCARWPTPPAIPI